MPSLAALAMSIGSLAAVATWFFLSSWSGDILIWAAFFGWACFFHCGGDTAALRTTVVCNAFGAFCCWITLVAIESIPLGAVLTPPLWAAIVVGITASIVVLGSSIPAFSSIPASFYGYNCVAAFALQTPEKLSVSALTSVSLDNALVVVPISMVIGAMFGFTSGKLAEILTTRKVTLN